MALTLRKMTIDSGIEIDDKYRNENSISMQITSISSLLNEKETGLHGASKLFAETVELYKQDKNEYNLLLSEVKGGV